MKDGNDLLGESEPTGADLEHRIANILQILNSSNRILSKSSKPEIIVGIADALERAAHDLKQVAGSSVTGCADEKRAGHDRS